MFVQISAGGRAHVLTSTLNRALDSLNQSIVTRNELIDIWKTTPELLGNDLVHFYFGLPNKQGYIDQRYSDSIEAICSLTDDCIFSVSCFAAI